MELSTVIALSRESQQQNNSTVNKDTKENLTKHCYHVTYPPSAPSPRAKPA